MQGIVCNLSTRARLKIALARAKYGGRAGKKCGDDSARKKIKKIFRFAIDERQKVLYNTIDRSLLSSSNTNGGIDL